MRMRVGDREANESPQVGIKFDDIIQILGDFGPYQKRIFFLVCIPIIITSMDSLSWSFTGAKMYHRCKSDRENSTADYWTPADPGLYKIKNCSSGNRCPFEECRLGDSHYCPYGYVYDNVEIGYSALQRWDLVCDRSVLRAIIQASYYVGQMFGSLMFGFLSDRIGRKKVFFVAIILQFLSGITMALSPHWTMYAVARLFVGLAHPGIFVVAVVIGVELIGPSYRKFASVSPSIFWAVGQVLLATLAYLIYDYRLLHAVIAIPALIFISYWWLIPESARWLVAHNRCGEADKILQHAAAINNVKLPEGWTQQVSIMEESNETFATRKYNFTDLIRTSSLRRRTIAVFVCWPVCSMMYYGISMNANFLGGDLYFTFALAGLVEIPSVILSSYLLDRIGRKSCLSLSFFTASFTMLTSLIVNENSCESCHYVGIAQSLMSKSAMAAAYTTLYAFTPELFPTVIRNIAMGGASMMARFGAITASLISMWLVDSYGTIVMVLPFSICGIVAGFVCKFCLPETKGQALVESIEDV